MRLEEAIAAHFSAADMAALADDLEIDRRLLPLGELAAKARAVALLEAAGRAGRARDLTAALIAAHPTVAWTALPWPPAALAPLHAGLCRRHTLDSLRTLCFRLGLDYDELPGETKSGRARELVLAMNRAGRVMELWQDTKYEIRDTSGASDELRVASDELRSGRAALKRTGPFPRPRRMTSLFTRISYFVSRLSPPVLLMVAAGAALLVLAEMNAHGDAVPITRLTSPAPSPSATPTFPLLANHPLLPTVPLFTDPLVTDHSPLPTASLAPAPIVIVGSRGANLRRGPSASFAVVATLRAGARLELLAVSPTGEWYQVRFPGYGSPWIDAGYAEIVGATGGLPVATAAVPSVGVVGATVEPGSRPANGPPASPTPRPTTVPTMTTGAATAAPTRTAPPPPLPLPTLPPP